MKNSSNNLPTDTKSDAFKYNIQVLDRALKIFETIARSRSPLSIQELQNATGLNRTTIWRILSTMMDSGFLTQLPHSKQYCLSCKACNLLSTSAASSIALIEYARPEMQRLRQFTGETVLLLLPEAIGSRTVLQLDSFETIRLKDYTNEVTPLFGTSTGIVQLSALTDEEIQNVLPETLPSYTEFTPTSKDELLKRIRKCRKNGYAYIINEYNQGDTGVSVPIYLESKLAGMLNIAGPTMRFTEERVLACIPELKKSALQISQELTS